MATTKIKTPKLLDLPNDSISIINTSGTVIPAGITAPSITVDYLVIAGGGAGGHVGGGGGAGGYLNSYGGEASGGNSTTLVALNLSLNTTYTVIVGAGGATGTSSGNADDGNDSKFGIVGSEIIAIGGGGGAKSSSNANPGGGSGGGGGSNTNSQTGAAGTTNQGSAGGDNYTLWPYTAGGGGGAGGAGNNGSGTGGNGGAGLSSSITGIATIRAGGGGGCAQQSQPGGTGGTGGGGNGTGDSTQGGAGTVNTGSGGGGGGYVGTGGDGGAGGSGIIILRVSSTTTATFTAGVTSALTQVGGGTWTSGDKVYTITATSSGSETVSFTSSSLSPIRPTTNLNTGEFRFNTATGYVEYYDGTNWYQIADEHITGQPTSCLCNYPNNTNIALYTFQDNTDDTCGTYNGTASNLNPYTASGKYRKAAVFNGTNSLIEASDPNANGGARSFSAWIKTTSTAFQGIITNGGTSHASGLNMFVYNDKLYSTSGNGTSGENYGPTSSASINTGEWVHCVLTLSGTASGSTIKAYVNGDLDGTHTTTITITDTYDDFRIGGRYLNGSNVAYFNGEIDQVRIFNSALTQIQVTELYNEIACN